VATALGFEPRAVPLMAVAGYFSDLRSTDEQLAEMDRFVQEGYSTLKLILPGHDAKADRRFLEDVRSHVPDHVAIAIDFHGAFESVREGLEHCAALHDLGVRFIEDPYPSADWHRVRDFARASPTPVAGGEDLPGLTGLVDLVDHGVQYLRADATASGGYSTTRRAVSHAVTAGASVRPHVWPHVHIHLAAGCPGDTPVEVIPDHVGADPVWSLLSEGAPISAGLWQAPSVPGLGIPFDEEAVSAHAVDSFRLELRAPVGADV
jgi:L-alanine-DL-glutamate epimerase-like enolase superfamily enzyme